MLPNGVLPSRLELAPVGLLQGYGALQQLALSASRAAFRQTVRWAKPAWGWSIPVSQILIPSIGHPHTVFAGRSGDSGQAEKTHSFIDRGV